MSRESSDNPYEPCVDKVVKLKDGRVQAQVRFKDKTGHSVLIEDAIVDQPETMRSALDYLHQEEGLNACGGGNPANLLDTFFKNPH